MRKFLIALSFGISGLAYAQPDAVTDAFLFNKDGELDKAKEAIDRAAVHEKTKDKPKTWYFRGMIYENLLTTQNPKFKGVFPDAAKNAYESYSKAISMSKKGDEYFDQSASRLENLWGAFLNDGVKKYEAKDFQGSMASYELAQTIKPQDTTAYVYALYSALQTDNLEKTEGYTRKLFTMGRKSIEMYISLSRQARKLEKKEKALEIIQEGRKEYPSDKSMALEELDLYFQLGRGNEAKAKLEEAVKMDSTNASLYSILGNMYDQEAANEKLPAKDRDMARDKALKAYTRAIKLDPENLESNFNMGVYYFNRGAEMIKKINALDINTYQKKGKAMEAEAQNEFKKALPYFEACYKKNPSDEGVKKSLKNTYERLGRSADAEKIGN